MICDVPDETVKALVGCLEFTIFLAVTVDVAYASTSFGVTLALS